MVTIQEEHENSSQVCVAAAEKFLAIQKNQNLLRRHSDAGKENKRCQWAREEPGALRDVPSKKVPDKAL